jgi:hypothetical protein
MLKKIRNRLFDVLGISSLKTMLQLIKDDFLTVRQGIDDIRLRQAEHEVRQAEHEVRMAAWQAATENRHRKLEASLHAVEVSLAQMVRQNEGHAHANAAVNVKADGQSTERN